MPDSHPLAWQYVTVLVYMGWKDRRHNKRQCRHSSQKVNARLDQPQERTLAVRVRIRVRGTIKKHNAYKSCKSLIKSPSSWSNLAPTVTKPQQGCEAAAYVLSFPVISTPPVSRWCMAAVRMHQSPKLDRRIGYLPLISGSDRLHDVNLIAVFEWHICFQQY